MITYDTLPEQHELGEIARTRRGDCHISNGVYWHEIHPVVAERIAEIIANRDALAAAYRELLGVSNVTIAVAREIARKNGVGLLIFGDVFGDEPQ